MSIAENYLTPQQYLEIERAAERKSEYHAGRMYLMAGATEAHVLICTNLLGELRVQLREHPCRVYNSEMRVRVEASGLYTYPDVTVACGDAAFEDGRRDILLNPSLIVEILSPSTKSYDRGAKFEFNRKLNSLRGYVLVAQDRLYVEHFCRQGAGEPWFRTELIGPAAVLDLPDTGCKLALAEIYHKVEFPASVQPE
jgi:Uma2 family endonuclease